MTSLEVLGVGLSSPMAAVDPMEVGPLRTASLEACVAGFFFVDGGGRCSGGERTAKSFVRSICGVFELLSGNGRSKDANPTANNLDRGICGGFALWAVLVGQQRVGPPQTASYKTIAVGLLS